LYDEIALGEAIESREFIFYISELDGKPAGMSGSRFSQVATGCLEGMALVVKLEFRGRYVSVRLSRAQMTDARRLGCQSMFYDMSTLDIKSQSLEFKDYAVPTGFVLNRFYLDKSAPNHSTAAVLPERCHHLIMTKAMRKRGTGRLYIPPELEECTNRVYASFEGIEVMR
jgi:hypothetical protein